MRIFRVASASITSRVIPTKHGLKEPLPAALESVLREAAGHFPPVEAPSATRRPDVGLSSRLRDYPREIGNLTPLHLAGGQSHVPVKGDFDQHSILLLDCPQQAIERSRGERSLSQPGRQSRLR
jgi:hypothetical protein